MHPRSLEMRRRAAQETIIEAALVLADGRNLSPLVDDLNTAHHADYRLKDLFRLEALARLMQAVADNQSPDAAQPRSVAPSAAHEASEGAPAKLSASERMKAINEARRARKTA